MTPESEQKLGAYLSAWMYSNDIGGDPENETTTTSLALKEHIEKLERQADIVESLRHEFEMYKRHSKETSAEFMDAVESLGAELAEMERVNEEDVRGQRLVADKYKAEVESLRQRIADLESGLANEREASFAKEEWDHDNKR